VDESPSQPEKIGKNGSGSLTSSKGASQTKESVKRQLSSDDSDPRPKKKQKLSPFNLQLEDSTLDLMDTEIDDKTKSKPPTKKQTSKETLINPAPIASDATLVLPEASLSHMTGINEPAYAGQLFIFRIFTIGARNIPCLGGGGDEFIRARAVNTTTGGVLEVYLADNVDGSYSATMFPVIPGTYRVSVEFDIHRLQHIKGSPFNLDVQQRTKTNEIISQSSFVFSETIPKQSSIQSSKDKDGFIPPFSPNLSPMGSPVRPNKTKKTDLSNDSDDYWNVNPQQHKKQKKSSFVPKQETIFEEREREVSTEEDMEEELEPTLVLNPPPESEQVTQPTQILPYATPPTQLL